MSISEHPAQRLALIGMAASALLAIAKIWIGMNANSTSAVADGLESAADIFSSGIVFLGLWIAQRPADKNQHLRSQFRRIGSDTVVPRFYAVATSDFKLSMSLLKMRQGRKMDSAALIADAKNDGVDVVSSTIALLALGLTLYDPVNLLEADHIGGAIIWLA